ncbi:BirA family transcriptional regulator, biotin operon repressor / biotin-[acetyl-CoA-carboxylase] ligase [Dethiosulfatibacter aminovorans DSM 17477]|uniref:Bifunctional ligase/repressor BirA n=1 Tax=Dethiosulfatibacter aminovorans DSM 17477 TaxID=1121476 RepID=A0A1M6B1Y3_9FIRM|nr:biotin--[acetyl-CoA-carboxylase] ligase [Dethiosulfatibacter aminovorans]SHI42493.1 BirA family transcriptional regulator, biotin operon repressor / biotin-[acetyl-CoA-carboxylase] ligase [Dethiosulfatibacter aminovorans DSM 17477]
MKEKILHILNSEKDFVSGEEISRLLGVSRAAVWKHMKALKEEGYEIESVSRKGYRLVQSPDLLTEEEVKKHVTADVMGRKIVHFDSVDSTNTAAKELADKGEEHGTVIIGEEQTAGKGRLGRSWVSPKYKGIWFSFILRPEINPMLIAKVTQVAAAAVVKAGDEMGFDFKVKWPNDIIMNDKKVCGILTEMSAELNQINYVIPGIGINANLDIEDFDKELKEKASSIKIESGKAVDRKELVGRIINNFEELYDSFMADGKGIDSIRICRDKSILIGREVRVIRGGQTAEARVLDLNDDGELVVEWEGGRIEKLFSGEVSVRGKKGYVL